jgi:hypothetical protein
MLRVVANATAQCQLLIFERSTQTERAVQLTVPLDLPSIVAAD